MAAAIARLIRRQIDSENRWLLGDMRSSVNGNYNWAVLYAVLFIKFLTISQCLTLALVEIIAFTVNFMSPLVNYKKCGIWSFRCRRKGKFPTMVDSVAAKYKARGVNEPIIYILRICFIQFLQVVLAKIGAIVLHH